MVLCIPTNCPRISVVITAYNRRGYLAHALDSLLYQDLEKNQFETILITNFQFELDKYEELQIRHFIFEGSLGQYLKKGISEASSDIVCFLDDDDLYTPNKLGRILNTFKSDCDYYRHKVENFDERILNFGQGVGKTTVFEPKRTLSDLIKLRNENFDFNGTSICIRKRFIEKYLDLLGNITACVDDLLFLSFLDSGKKGVIDEERLSYYRVRIKRNRGHEEMQNQIRLYREMIISLTRMRKYFTETWVQIYLDYRLSLIKFLIYFWSTSPIDKPNLFELKHIIYMTCLRNLDGVTAKIFALRCFLITFFPQLYNYFNPLDSYIGYLFDKIKWGIKRV